MASGLVIEEENVIHDWHVFFTCVFVFLCYFVLICDTSDIAFVHDTSYNPNFIQRANVELESIYYMYYFCIITILTTIELCLYTGTVRMIEWSRLQ